MNKLSPLANLLDEIVDTYPDPSSHNHYLELAYIIDDIVELIPDISNVRLAHILKHDLAELEFIRDADGKLLPWVAAVILHKRFAIGLTTTEGETEPIRTLYALNAQSRITELGFFRRIVQTTCPEFTPAEVASVIQILTDCHSSTHKLTFLDPNL